MKKDIKMAALLLVGAMAAACTGNGQKQTEENVNENPQEEKIEVTNVEGRQNFQDMAVITPLPAIMIATYDKDGVPDVMMAAWGGQCGPRHINFFLSPHKTTDNIKLKKAFTVSFASKDNVKESDYFGIVSGNDVPDKVARAGFTATPSPNVDAPIINEYPLTLECRVVEMEETSLGSTRVVGEVINMSAKDEILNEEGKIDMEKLLPVVFDSSDNSYRVVGEKVGTAWGTGKAIIEAQVK